LKEAEEIAAEANLVSDEIGKELEEEKNREKVDFDALSNNIDRHY